MFHAITEVVISKVSARVFETIECSRNLSLSIYQIRSSLHSTSNVVLFREWCLMISILNIRSEKIEVIECSICEYYSHIFPRDYTSLCRSYGNRRLVTCNIEYYPTSNLFITGRWFSFFFHHREGH